MRHLAIVVSFVFFPAVAVAQGKLTPRPLDPLAAATFTRAIEGSAVVRALVERLESSNVIVHIETAAQMPAGIGGTTRFVTSRGGYRYLRITLGSVMTLKARSAILAHELKHACEVADSPASDTQGMRELFEHQGHRSGEFFETMAAIRVERDVWLELNRKARALQAEPIVKFDH
jgi:hypothetical protein